MKISKGKILLLADLLITLVPILFFKDFKELIYSFRSDLNSVIVFCITGSLFIKAFLGIYIFLKDRKSFNYWVIYFVGSLIFLIGLFFIYQIQGFDRAIYLEVEIPFNLVAKGYKACTSEIITLKHN